MNYSRLLTPARPSGRSGSGWRSGSSVVPMVLCAAILTLGALFFLWQRYQFVRLGFSVAGLRQQKAVLEEAIEPLEIEVDYLSRPQRIEAIATGRLRMRLPRPSQVRTMSDNDAAKFSSQ